MARAASAASVGGSAGSCQPSPSADLDTYEVVVTYSHWEAAVCSTSLTLEDMVAGWEFGREVGLLLPLLRALWRGGRVEWASFAKKHGSACCMSFGNCRIQTTHRCVAWQQVGMMADF